MASLAQCVRCKLTIDIYFFYILKCYFPSIVIYKYFNTNFCSPSSVRMQLVMLLYAKVIYRTFPNLVCSYIQLAPKQSLKFSSNFFQFYCVRSLFSTKNFHRNFNIFIPSLLCIRFNFGQQFFVLSRHSMPLTILKFLIFQKKLQFLTLKIYSSFSKFPYSQQSYCPVRPEFGLKVCLLRRQLMPKTVLSFCFLIFWHFLTLKNALFPLNSQKFHFHSKFIV